MPSVKSGRTLTFFALVAFSLAQLFWWCYYQVRRADQVRVAASALTDNAAERVPIAFGASDAHDLAELAKRQRRMFLVEGTSFALVVLLVAVLFWRALRREDEFRARQDRFLAGATHELKTPIATLRLGLESIQDERLPEAKRRRYASELDAQLTRLESGIENILGAAGLRSAEAKLQLVRANLVDDISAALSRIRDAALAGDLRFEVVGDADVPIMRDASAMRMILHNLFDNAIKYSPNSTSCTIEVRRDDDGATLAVRDRGRGMSERELAHAFDAFWRGRDDHVGGTGLGLFLVRELVHAHGGEVGATSDGPDKGTCIRIRFPSSGAAG